MRKIEKRTEVFIVHTHRTNFPFVDPFTSSNRIKSMMLIEDLFLNSDWLPEAVALHGMSLLSLHLTYLYFLHYTINLQSNFKFWFWPIKWFGNFSRLGVSR
jgi:hypothetical protein